MLHKDGMFLRVEEICYLKYLLLHVLIPCTYGHVLGFTFVHGAKKSKAMDGNAFLKSIAPAPKDTGTRWFSQGVIYMLVFLMLPNSLL